MQVVDKLSNRIYLKHQFLGKRGGEENHWTKIQMHFESIISKEKIMLTVGDRLTDGKLMFRNQLKRKKF